MGIGCVFGSFKGAAVNAKLVSPPRVLGSLGQLLALVLGPSRRLDSYQKPCAKVVSHGVYRVGQSAATWCTELLSSSWVPLSAPLQPLEVCIHRLQAAEQEQAFQEIPSMTP